MFDVSLGEAAMVGLVAMLVIGPKRLPAVAKTVGLVVGRVQRFMAGIKSELQATSESSGLAELQRELHNASIMARAQVEESLRQAQADALASTQDAANLEANLEAIPPDEIEQGNKQKEGGEKGGRHG